MSYLMRCSSGDKHGVAQTLKYGVTGNSVFGVESHAKFPIQVPALIVNRVMMGFETLATFQSHLSKEKLL